MKIQPICPSIIKTFQLLSYAQVMIQFSYTEEWRINDFNTRQLNNTTLVVVFLSK